MDVTPGGLGVSSDSDERLLIWETASGDVRVSHPLLHFEFCLCSCIHFVPIQRSLEGHLSDVYCCRFFPSGIVVLSGGADMQVKVWAAEDGRCDDESVFAKKVAVH